MFCSNCGKEVVEGAKFCAFCGASLVVIETETEEKGRKAKKADKSELRKENKKESRKDSRKKGKKGTARKDTDRQEEKTRYYELHQPDQLAPDEYDYRSLPTKKLDGIRGIYPLDFVIRMTQHGNIPTLIYLIINVCIIGLVCTAMFALPIWWGLIAGLIVYAASVCIALSPIGEWILREKTHCSIIKDPDVIRYIEPIFREVYYKAKKENPEISPDVRLFMYEDEFPNAFATGRETVCISTGLLSLDPQTIKGVLAHEFGHLAHRDTDKTLVVTVGNMIVNAIIICFRIGIEIFRIIMSIFGIILGGREGLVFGLFMHLYSLLILAVVIGLTKLWTWIGILLVMKTSRQNEYDADAFANQLGYGRELCALFYLFSKMDDAPAQKGVFAALSKSHPDDLDRIQHLNDLGAGFHYPA